ncbi:MAG: ATP-binding protein [Planctomycetota bacterium]
MPRSANRTRTARRLALKFDFGTALRLVGVGLLFGAATSVLKWPSPLFLGAAAAGLVLLERRLAGHDVANPYRRELDLATERQREAVAHTMALELGFDRLQAVLESLGEGVLVADGAGEIVLLNPQARHVLARPYVDPVGKVLWDSLAPGIAHVARAAFDSVQAARALQGEHGEAQRHPSILCRGRFYEVTAVPVKSTASGQDFGIAFLFVDTTRNHELQQLKDRFLSSVSHELRTPLTNICAYSEILGTMLPGETVEWPEFVRIIHDESVHVSRLVDGMFDYLQLESGEAAFRQENVDGAALVEAMVAAVRRKAGERGIEIATKILSGQERVQADATRLEQVVTNLLDNAIKFTPANGKILVMARVSDGGFEFRVADSGPGVPESDRSAVFEKFHQLSDHLTDKPTGTGLGLATSRAIIARFGGLIWCEDSPLGGACFVVRLPLSGQPSLIGSTAALAF